MRLALPRSTAALLMRFCNKRMGGVTAMLDRDLVFSRVTFAKGLDSRGDP